MFLNTSKCDTCARHANCSHTISGQRVTGQPGKWYVQSSRFVIWQGCNIVQLVSDLLFLQGTRHIATVQKSFLWSHTVWLRMISALWQYLSWWALITMQFIDQSCVCSTKYEYSRLFVCSVLLLTLIVVSAGARPDDDKSTMSELWTSLCTEQIQMWNRSYLDLQSHACIHCSVWPGSKHVPVAPC